jgi:hypothetical protein
MTRKLLLNERKPMSVELGNCPICNKKPKQMLAKVTYCQLHGEPSQDFIIKCCYIHIQQATREDCIETWNKYARPSPARISNVPYHPENCSCYVCNNAEFSANAERTSTELPKLCKCNKDRAMTVRKINDDFFECPRCGGLMVINNDERTSNARVPLNPDEVNVWLNKFLMDIKLGFYAHHDWGKKFCETFAQTREEIGEDLIDKAVKDGEDNYATNYKNKSWGTKTFKTKRQCIIESIVKSLRKDN